MFNSKKNGIQFDTAHAQITQNYLFTGHTDDSAKKVFDILILMHVILNKCS